MTQLVLNTEGERDVVITRNFAAAPADVYRAHIEPDLIRQWMLGPDGWSMSECISDAQPGGALKFAWTDGKGGGFHLTGEYIALTPGAAITHVERMHLPDPTPDNHIDTTFEDHNGGTRLTVRMTLPDAETRQAMLSTGMEHGMEASYARIDEVLGAA